MPFRPVGLMKVHLDQAKSSSMLQEVESRYGSQREFEVWRRVNLTGVGHNIACNTAGPPSVDEISLKEAQRNPRSYGVSLFDERIENCDGEEWKRAGKSRSSRV